jgi:ribose transport system substrate-binding protein
VKKVVGTVLILLAVLLAVTSCSKTAAKKQIIIGFNNGSTTVDFLRQVGESMQRAADKAGVKLLVAESNFDAEKILPNVDNLVLQGAQIIVDFNVNAQIGGSLVDYLAPKNIKVIGIDVAYTGAKGDQAWFFGANNQQAGEVAGAGLAKAIKDKWGGQVDALVLFFNSENGDLVKKRLTGMADGMKAAGIALADSKIILIDMRRRIGHDARRQPEDDRLAHRSPDAPSHRGRNGQHRDRAGRLLRGPVRQP